MGDAQGLGCNAVHGWRQRTFRWSVQEASHESRARSRKSRRQRASAPHRTRNLQGAGSFRPAASHGLAACGASPGCEMGPAEVPGPSQDPPVFPGLQSLGLRSHTSVLQALQPPPASPPPHPKSVHIACDTTSRPCENVTFSGRPSLTTLGAGAPAKTPPFLMSS